MVSDFHFLLYLITDAVPKFSLVSVVFSKQFVLYVYSLQVEIMVLCNAIKTKDASLLETWMRETENWTRFVDGLNGEHVFTRCEFLSLGCSPPGAEMEQGVPNGINWTCRHCTYVNRNHLDDCEMCTLPRI